MPGNKWSFFMHVRECACCKRNHRDPEKYLKPTFKYNIRCRMVTVKVATTSLQNTMMSSLMTQSSTSTMVGTGTNQSILGFSLIRYCFSIPENLTRCSMKPMKPCHDTQRYVDTIMHHEPNASSFQVVWVCVCVSHQSLLLRPAELCTSAHPWTKHTAMVVSSLLSVG